LILVLLVRSLVIKSLTLLHKNFIMPSGTSRYFFYYTLSYFYVYTCKKWFEEKRFRRYWFSWSLITFRVLRITNQRHTSSCRSNKFPPLQVQFKRTRLQSAKCDLRRASPIQIAVLNSTTALTRKRLVENRKSKNANSPSCSMRTPCGANISAQLNVVEDSSPKMNVSRHWFYWISRDMIHLNMKGENIMTIPQIH
jgi:hypothetical protein